MDKQFGKNVVTVRTFQKTPSGDVTSERLYSKRGKRKKSLRNLSGVDKFVRRLVIASAEGANVLAERHERSSDKKRSGGLRDLGKNLMKASRKTSKRLKLFKF